MVYSRVQNVTFLFSMFQHLIYQINCLYIGPIKIQNKYNARCTFGSQVLEIINFQSWNPWFCFFYSNTASVLAVPGFQFQLQDYVTMVYIERF